MPTEKILFVDDDANLLAAYRRQLRARFLVETAESGPEGLSRLVGGEKFAAIVSDLRMPGMDGIELLSKAATASPDTVRVMLTGNADLQASINAVNEGQIFRFLVKPCLPVDLVRALEQSVRQHQLLVAERALLEETLAGATRVLADVLGLINPLAFSQSLRWQRHMKSCALRLELPDPWELEIAALLANLGCITIPAETLARVEAGDAIDQDEADVISNHPRVAQNLLAPVPRLERVAEIIGARADSLRLLVDRLHADPKDRVAIAAVLLHGVIAVDRALARGAPASEAVAELERSAGGQLPDALAQALANPPDMTRDVIVRELSIRELASGMTLDQDILGINGTLLLSRGHELGPALLERLRIYARRGTIHDRVRVRIGQSHEISSEILETT